jgi:hypothetical protein
MCGHIGDKSDTITMSVRFNSRRCFWDIPDPQDPSSVGCSVVVWCLASCIKQPFALMSVKFLF